MAAKTEVQRGLMQARAGKGCFLVPVTADPASGGHGAQERARRARTSTRPAGTSVVPGMQRDGRGAGSPYRRRRADWPYRGIPPNAMGRASGIGAANSSPRGEPRLAPDQGHLKNSRQHWRTIKLRRANPRGALSAIRQTMPNILDLQKPNGWPNLTDESPLP